LLDPLTAAVNCRLWPAETVLEPGERLTDTAGLAGLTMMVAAADWVGSAALVAVTVIAVAEDTLLGAV
jgi:hypothetical protein